MRGILFTTILGIFTLIGFIVGKDLKGDKKITNISISISLIVMLGIVIFKTIPWSYHLLSNLDVLPDIKTFVGINNFGIIILVISMVIGFLVLKLIDSFIPDHELTRKNKQDYYNHIATMSSIVIICYSFLSSMMLYVITVDDFKKGLLLSLSLGLLNVPLGLLVSLLKKQVKIPMIIMTIIPLIGGITMLLLINIIGEALVGVLMSVVGGMIIYLLISEILKQVINTREKKDVYIGIAIGILISGISLILG